MVERALALQLSLEGGDSGKSEIAGTGERRASLEESRLELKDRDRFRLLVYSIIELSRRLTDLLIFIYLMGLQIHHQCGDD